MFYFYIMLLIGCCYWLGVALIPYRYSAGPSLGCSFMVHVKINTRPFIRRTAEFGKTTETIQTLYSERMNLNPHQSTVLPGY